ncbi:MULTISPECIES: hypothetical protein [Paenibacillus]|uniref:hypothetical protein n=1 Tax=Paenibacillus TaxID=44249 RepID=UPI0011B47FA1|nr:MULTISPECIES: hypothetical protein [Paenibacillus]
MAESPSEKKLTANEMILQKLKETFDRNENITVDRVIMLHNSFAARIRPTISEWESSNAFEL